MAGYDDFEDDLYQRHSQRRVTQWDDYQDRVSGSIEGSERGDRRVYVRQPREWRDPDLDDRSHSRDRSWDARDWDTERDDRREQDYDQMSRDRREREEKYRGRTNRDIDESFGDPIEQDLLPDWGDWGEEAEDEMDLNVLPVSEGRRHTFIPGRDDLNVLPVSEGRRHTFIPGGDDLNVLPVSEGRRHTFIPGRDDLNVLPVSEGRRHTFIPGGDDLNVLPVSEGRRHTFIPGGDDLNVLPVSEGRRHTFIPGGDDLDNQSQVRRSRRADRHPGHKDQLWAYEGEPLARLPVHNTMEEWNVLKSDVQTKTIMLTGLPRITRPADVYHVLHGFHTQVLDMQIETSPTGDHEGVAFIVFFTIQHAVKWMEKIQGSVELLNCEVKADYSLHVLKSSERAVHTWRNWATTVPSDTLVFWNVPPSLGENAMRGLITQYGFKPTNVIMLKNRKSGTYRGYGYFEFGSVAEAVEVMDFTKGVLDMDKRAILVTYSSGGKKDDKYTAAEHRAETDNKDQMQGAMDDPNDGTMYISNLPVNNTMGEWNALKSDVQTKTIMLSGLPRITRPAEVYQLLHGFHHQVRDMQIETSPTGDHEGVAFIDFFTQQHAVNWMEKIQGSVEVLKCEVKADYSSLVLKSEKAVHTWQKWATTVPSDTLVFWNVPPFLGGNAIRFQITESGFKTTKVIIMKNNRPGGSGKSKGYGFIGFGSVAEAVEFMDFTKGVLDMIETAILVTYSSGGNKDDKYTAAEHRAETDNKEQVQGAMDDQKEGIVYVSNLTPEVTHQMIMEVFQLAGEVLKVKKDVTTATVRFRKHQDAVQAISMLNGMILLESKIAVSEEQPKTVKTPVVKTNMDINLIRTKQYLYDPSTDKYYKKIMLKKCPVAGCSMKKPVDWKGLARHWAEIHTPTKKKFTCPIKDCNIGLTHSETHLRTHLQAEHDVKGDNLDKKINGAKFYLIQNEKYSDPGNVVLPKLTQVKGLNIKIPKTQCQVEGCAHTYTTMASMQQHWAKYHRATVKMYSCSLCQGRMRGKSLLQEHLHKTHNVDYDDSKAELVEWKNRNFIDPGDVIPFWSLYTEEDGMNHRELEKELGEDFPLADIPLDELEKDNPNLYDLYEWTEQYMHRLEVARKYALSDLQELTCKALEED